MGIGLGTRLHRTPITTIAQTEGGWLINNTRHATHFSQEEHIEDGTIIKFGANRTNIERDKAI